MVLSQAAIVQKGSNIKLNVLFNKLKHTYQVEDTPAVFFSGMVLFFKVFAYKAEDMLQL